MNNIEKITELLDSGVSIGRALKEVCGDKTISIPFNEKIFDMPLEELSLSTRSYNALKREKINTLNDAVHSLENQGWRDIKNLGKVSATEIFEAIIDVAWRNMSDAQKRNFLISIG